jgi:hypothetical protein
MARATQVLSYDDQRVEPNDEDFHAVGADPTWSESYYFYFFDQTREIGGYTRLGFRPHDGWRDALHMLFLEGSRIGFCYEREAHRATDRNVKVGGTQLSMREPFKQWRLDFEGDSQDCPDGRVLATPRKERSAGWCDSTRARVALDYSGLAPPFYTERAGAGGHFEQPGSVRGEIRLGEELWPFEGLGIRDKSWGPRPWTNQTGASDRDELPDSPFGQGKGWRVYGIWLTAVFGSGLAFAVTASPTPEGGLRSQGYLVTEGRNYALRAIDVHTDYASAGLFHERCSFEAHFEEDHILRATGVVLNSGPSKIPHERGATIVNAAMTRFTLDSGETGLGITEYHSSVVRPA